MKKILSILIIFMLLFVSACGNKKSINKTNSDNDKTDELYRIKTLITFTDSVGIQEGWFGQYIKDKFNIEIEYMKKDSIVTGDVNLADYDLIVCNGYRYIEAIDNNELMSFEDNNLLNTYGKNIIKNIESNINYSRRISNNEKLYGLCTNFVDEDEPDVFENTWNIRWDLYKEEGYPSVENIDEYIAVLKSIKNNYQEKEDTDDICVLFV